MRKEFVAKSLEIKKLIQFPISSTKHVLEGDNRVVGSVAKEWSALPEAPVPVRFAMKPRIQTRTLNTFCQTVWTIPPACIFPCDNFQDLNKVCAMEPIERPRSFRSKPQRFTEYMSDYRCETSGAQAAVVTRGPTRALRNPPPGRPSQGRKKLLGMSHDRRWPFQPVLRWR